MLAQAILFVLWMILIVMVAASSESNDSPAAMMAVTLFGFLFWVVMLVPTLAVQVRRFHDQGLSGWFVLLHFVPYLGTFAVLVFMFIKGNDGPNKFGPDPRGNDEDHYRRVFGDEARPRVRMPETY